MNFDNLNAYQWDRLAWEHGLTSGASLKADLEAGVYSVAHIAARIGTTPDALALRVAFWNSEAAPKVPPVIVVAGPTGA